MSSKPHKLNLYTAISIVVSSMIGTGIFTSLGLQVAGLPSVFAILVLWVIGGLVAICGALNYGELAVAFPRSGGEYNYLSILYHPLLGFLSAFVSAIVGFAAPAAISSMAFSYYFHTATGIDATVLVACCVLIFLTITHSFHLKWSSILQNISTTLNLLLIVFFIIAGFIKGPNPHFSFTNTPAEIKMLFSEPFAVSLIYVYFAYTGWNSAIYIASEISKPQKNLSRSLLYATVLVMVLYLLLNFIFLYVTPINDLKGKIDIGFICAHSIFGLSGGRIISLIICVALLSSVSSYLFFGPRVLQVLGEDYAPLKWLTYKNKHGLPIIALFFQSALALAMILTSSFDSILSVTGIVLSLFTTFTVAGVFILRTKKKKYTSKFKAVGYPLTGIFFLLVEVWMIYYTLKVKTTDSLIGISLLTIGIIFYFLLSRNQTQELRQAAYTNMKSGAPQ